MKKFYIILICLIVIACSVSIYFQLSPSDGILSRDQNTTKDKTTPALSTAVLSIPATYSPSPTPTMSPSPPAVEIPNMDVVNDKIIKDIQDGFPGAVLLVSQNGEIIFNKAYGNLKIYDGDTKLLTPVSMKTDTIFDVASLTKLYATAFSVMILIDSKMLTLDSFVYEYLPEFDKEDYNKITIRHLLSHTSGFPSDVKFFRPDVEEGKKFYSTERNNTISLLSEVPLENEPGSKAQYSDIGYMVLGAIVEKVSGMRIDEFISTNVYEPLGLTGKISFLPLENNFSKNNIACTERMGNTRDGLVTFPDIRDYTLQGEVHDEKAFYSMQGVSGHAGLFSDTESLNILNQVLLGGGTYNGMKIISADTVNEFTSVYDDATYQLTFAHSVNINSLKDVVPFGTLSHTGWTGAFTLIDKQNNLSIVLLTNKRHSPITDGDFEAAAYDTGKYYSIVKLIYQSLGLS